MQDRVINFCKRDIMSVCTAGSEDHQKDCQFYRKSSYMDRCMYLVFGEYCDCVEAQLNTQKEVAFDLEDVAL